MDARSKSTGHRGEQPPIRLFALVALLIACCLLLWRGMMLVVPAEPAWTASNAAEAQLMGVLEPIAGHGNLRLTVSETPAGARSVLILLESAVADLGPSVERIARQSAGLDTDAGDRLVIETADFATRGFTSTTPADMMEIFATAMICVALAWIALALGREPVVLAATPRRREDLSDHKPDFAPDIRRERGEAQAGLMPDTEAVARVARKDPAQAAKIIRNWMRQNGGEG